MDTIKYISIHIMEATGGRNREKGVERIFEEIMAKKLPKFDFNTLLTRGFLHKLIPVVLIHLQSIMC